MNPNQAKVNATTTKAHLNHENTGGLMEHVPTPVQNATAKQTITVMKQPLRICMVDHLLVATGCRHDNLGLQIVVLMM